MQWRYYRRAERVREQKELTRAMAMLSPSETRVRKRLRAHAMAILSPSGTHVRKDADACNGDTIAEWSARADMLSATRTTVYLLLVCIHV